MPHAVREQRSLLLESVASISRNRRRSVTDDRVYVRLRTGHLPYPSRSRLIQGPQMLGDSLARVFAGSVLAGAFGCASGGDPGGNELGHTSQSLRGTLVFYPAVTSWASSRLDVFVRNDVDQFATKAYTADQGWGDWSALPLQLLESSPPAAVSWGSGRVDLFSRDEDGEIQHAWYNDGGGWFGWEDMGPSETTPAVSSWGSDRLDLFAKRQDTLWHRWYQGPFGWSDWESLGGPITSAPAAVSWGGGRIDVFARGPSNDLVHTWYNDGRGWAGVWEDLGCCAGKSGATVASWGPGRLDVFGIENDSSVWHRWYQDPFGWFGPENLGGSLDLRPAAVSWGPERIDVFGMGLADGQLQHLAYDPSFGWAGWDNP